MSFFSILFDNPDEDISGGTLQEPPFFSDLHLDQIVHAVTTGYEEYDLEPFFYHSLKSIDAITYRQEIVQELGDARLFEAIKSFSRRMQTVRNHLVQAEKLPCIYQKRRWFLDAVALYCEAIACLFHDLAHLDLKSRGFLAFREYLNRYVESADFRSLVAETENLREELSRARYCLLIRGKEITVLKRESDEDYIGEVESTFEKFLQEPVRPFHENFLEDPEMNHVEAKVLDLVAALYPEVFSHLDAFQEKNIHYLDITIARFNREIQFYISYLELVASIGRGGLSFCIPQVSDTNKEIWSREGFDLALAVTLSHEKKPIVTNDFYLEDEERIFVITGPNQGGKTTFARTFGQLHFLASIGCPVPGRSARLFLFDRLFSHFEREEHITDLKSKLENDLVRIHSIFSESTSRSIIIINEMFTSTTVQDALFLGRKVLEQAIHLDLLCVYVTFLDELSTLEKTVSLVSTMVPDNPDLRTYKIVRKPADGLSYAIAIARKHRLTYEDILERIQP
ncbi:MAG: hypothetical protein QMC96_04515 [Methanomicrobiales archaeon]|nr:hypothetical protein [Methanomicrobiales archaeon]